MKPMPQAQPRRDGEERAPALAPAHAPHAADAAAVAGALGVNPRSGLSESEVAARRARYGANSLQTIEARPAWRMLADQFASLVVALLATAAAVAWLTGDHADALAILAVLALNALVGFLTEWQANRALAALRREAHIAARVRRDGRELTVQAEALVPGDTIVLDAGDRVPADARLVEAVALRAEESALTGESAPVEKSAQAVAPHVPLAERNSMLYLGTTVVAGHGLAVVTATGAETELGRVGRLVAAAPVEATPLKRKLDELGRRLVYLVLLVGLVVMLAGWLRGDGLWLMIEVGISLAVAAVPEALPAVTTLTLALGLLRMARQRAVVRRLAAVETLGSTTIICADKTGTLTQNRMTVRACQLSDGRTLTPDAAAGRGAHATDDDLLARLLRVAALCNEASYDRTAPPGERSLGDPTETALLTAAESFGFDVQATRAAYTRLSELPFDAVTKRMLTVERAPDGRLLATLKGAPAVVLDACTHYVERDGVMRALDAPMRTRFLLANREMADQALRVLALAEKYAPEGARATGAGLEARAESEAKAGVESGFTFLGLLGLNDPPRAGVAEAIAQARAASLRVVMLTGDQLNTAQAVARELRLSGAAEPRALHAQQLAQADDARLAELARTTDVFARVSPEDKLRIVLALKGAGEVVAVTGDGVNDAPALKRADIGVAMGLRGTEVAKEAAAVVLADDNFATILRAVEGGRTIYANIVKFIHLMLSKNLGTVLAIFGAILLGWPLPLLPLQLLWLNLVTDVFPALALAVEPAAPDTMQRPPRAPGAALLTRPLITLILWQGALIALVILAAYRWALDAYGAGAHARTVMLCAVVGSQLGHLFNCRSRTRSVFAGLFRNRYAWGAVVAVALLQLLAIYFPPLARLLGTAHLTRADLLVTALTVAAPVLCVELAKLHARRRHTAHDS
jgi:Ca2+-transporting ATPase